MNEAIRTVHLTLFLAQCIIVFSQSNIHATSCFPNGSCERRTHFSTAGDDAVIASEEKQRLFYGSNCFCDSVCGIQDDCCEDAKIDSQRLDKNKYSCTPLIGKTFGVFTYNVCPSDYKKKKIKENCEVQADCVKDPFKCLPILSLNSHIAFKNIYCAVCNEGEMASNSSFWIPILNCRTLFPLPSLALIVKTLVDRIIYNPNTGEWEPEFNGDPLVSEGCSMSFEYPPEAAFIRQCKPRIDTCASDWIDEETKQLCENHTAFVYIKSSDNELEKTYRNIYCAACNYENLTNLECQFIPQKTKGSSLLHTVNYVFYLLNARLFDLSSSNLISSNFFLKDPVLRLGKSEEEVENIHARMLKLSPRVKASEFSYAILMDSDYSKGGNIVGSNQNCPSGQVFNSFKKKCQVVYCGGRYDTNC